MPDEGGGGEVTPFSNSNDLISPLFLNKKDGTMTDLEFYALERQIFLLYCTAAAAAAAHAGHMKKKSTFTQDDVSNYDKSYFFKKVNKSFRQLLPSRCPLCRILPGGW